LDFVSDSHQITLEVISCYDWRRLRKLRLVALRESPEAFLASYDQEKSRTKDWWLAELARGNWLVAVSGRRLSNFLRKRPLSFLGVTQERDTAARMRTIEYLWVAPRKRRSGVGLTFIKSIVSCLRSEGVQTVILAVLDGNEAAMSLYHKVGFTPDGTPTPLEERPGRTEQLLRMELTDAVPSDQTRPVIQQE